MKKRGAKKEGYKNKYLFPEDKRFSFRWFFGTSHLIMGLFAALGVLLVAVYLSNLFLPKMLAFLFIYLIIHLGLALDYYYDRNIGEKFLFFFYVFSIISFFIYFLLTFF